MFEDKVLETIKKYNMIQKGDKVVVAVSGGPDSMSLLNSLLNIKKLIEFKIVVAHVNHMIREVADEETEYVRNFCDRYNITCYVKKIDVIKKAESEKISTEEAGRNARYDFFEEVFIKENANKIAIAHNANDNAETVLMNIIRGTGVSGLKGIEPIRLQKFIRPLIEIERAEIEQYCENEKLNPKFDKSNEENVYTRNKVRNLLIPYIKDQFNPNIIESINRLSKLADQETKYIDNVIQNFYKEICICESSKDDNSAKIEEIVIDLNKYNNADKYIRGKIIMLCTYKIFGTTKGIEKKHIEDIIVMCEKNIGNKFLTPNKHFKIAVNKGRITISRVTI
ncbi:MAG: tRNA lysidine(34) synthetase TilS [Clostridia bacterium]|nr:tRNA lysidine(34) synthetase TilS [Clostridia bacterium]